MEGVQIVERCYLASKEAHITDKTFKVYIPRLQPDDSRIAEDNNVSVDTSLLINDIKVDKTLSTRNYINAKAMTDYRSYHHGDVFEMVSSVGITQPAKEDPDNAPWNCPVTKSPHVVNHVHEIEKPHEFHEMKYETLNDITIGNGTEMIGIFIGGDLFDFRIIHIPGVIPQRGD